MRVLITIYFINPSGINKVYWYCYYIIMCVYLFIYLYIKKIFINKIFLSLRRYKIIKQQI